MILEKIFPVVLMVFIGLFCRKTGIISQDGIGGLKTLATSFMLPVLLFHTLATTVYTPSTLLVIIIMLIALSGAFAAGMLAKKMSPSLGLFFPFLVTSYEGGMLGYPLYAVLCGEAALSNIATLDIANTIFVFTIFLAMLMSTVSGSFKTGEMVQNVLHSPVFWGVFAGIIVGVTGIAAPFLSTPAGAVYLAAKDMLTSAISAVILIVVGFGLSLERSVLAKCLKAALGRIVIQVVFLLLLLLILKNTLATPQATAALVLYMFLPPTFVVPVYAKTKEDSEYLSTTISIYSIITIIAFMAIAIFL